MAVKQEILKKIQELSSKNEAFYAGIKQELGATLPIGDVASTSFDILNDLLSGAESDNLTGLKERLFRLMELKKTVLLMDDKGEETKQILDSAKLVEDALKKHIEQKSKILEKAKNRLSTALPNIAETIENAFSDSPLLTLAFKTGKAIKKFKNSRKPDLSKRKQDAEDLYATQLRREKQNAAEISPTSSFDAFDTSDNFSSQTGASATSSLENVGQQNVGQQNDSSQLLSAVLEISSDVKKLVRLYEDEAKQRDIMEDNSAFDAIEANAEKSRNSLIMERGGIYGSSGQNLNISGGPGEPEGPGPSGGLFGGLINGIGTLAGAGVAGYLAKTRIGKAIGGALGKGKALISGAGKMLTGGNIITGAGKGLLSGAKNLLPKAGLQTLAKMGGKSAIKKIPIIGALAGLGFGAKRLFDGDVLGAVGEVGSGLASTVPGLGTAASVAIDAGLAARDMQKNSDGNNNSTSEMFTEPMSNFLNRPNFDTEKQKEDFIQRQAEAIAKELTPLFLGSSVKDKYSSGLLKNLNNNSSPKAIPAEPIIRQDSRLPGMSPGKNKMKMLALKELQAKGITDAQEQANILANLEAESNFTPRSEEIEKYSAKTLMRLYGPGSGNQVRFNSIEEAQQVIDAGPEAVGNRIYGGRMGNAADEGYKYRGRGLVQLTGKDNYTQMSKKIGIDLVSNPDLANDPEIAAKIQAQFYADRKNRFNYKDVSGVSMATGHAGGALENAKRAQLAQKYMGEIQRASLSPDMSAGQATNPSYQMVAKKPEPAPKQPTSITNVVNNNSSGGKGTNIDAPPIPQNGTSSRGASFTKGWLA